MNDNKKFQNDLTQGGVANRLVRFSAPFLLSMLIQQLYNMADLLIVSHFSGEASVSGVNNGGQLTFLATAMAIGLSVGGTILIGQYFGAKMMDDVQKTASTMLTSLLFASVLMTALFLPLGGLFLRALRVPEAGFGEARVYLNICVCGLPFIFLYNAISGILRGMGDSKRPLIFVAGACCANVFLDLLLVAVFHMDAAGAAIATVVSQAGSVVVSAVYLARSGFMFDFKRKSFVIHRDKLKLILRLGIPASISQVAVNLSFLLMSALVNGYGLSVSAAAGLAGRFNGFAIMPAQAVSNSVSMMSAQNLGADRHDRAIHTMRVGILLSLAVGIPVFAAAQLFTTQIMGVLSTVPDVIAAGAVYMRAFSWDYLLVPFVFCFVGLVNGAGHANVTLLNTFISSVGLRVPAALLLSRVFGLGLSGVGLAAPAASAGALIFLLLYLSTGRWRSVVIRGE
ncbi:MAG: MATE family efflux transporter [Oscillospiraceae bacterium]|jgi:putative MATE family efflux protein|nr:MATE family efflux transporter [Oscillospiraceae bacterium]